VNQHQGTDFEERLLVQLRGVVAERDAAQAQALQARPAKRRAPRLAMGGALAAAAVTAGLVVSAGGDNTSAAYAVEPQDGGGVNIQIYSLDDPKGVEGALEEAGVPAQVDYLPTLTACREPRYKASTLTAPGLIQGDLLSAFAQGGLHGPMTIAIGDEGQRQELSAQADLFVNPAWFQPDQTLVLTGAPDPYQGNSAGTNAAGEMTSVGVAEGPIAPCDPIPLSH
jgi:hypothetical protein